MLFRPPPFSLSCAHAHRLCILTHPATRHPRRHHALRDARTSQFHTSRVCYTDSETISHYETLQLPRTASPADIKRQFFSLSKLHHPDKNPNDPTASTRFVAISEAYHVLSVPEKRLKYDSHLYESSSRRSRWGGGDAPPEHGSYSSAGYAGSRPATGLNKKRGTFRGPPPSFYNSGGYGRHNAKRAEYAHHTPGSGAGTEQDANQESYGDFGSGMGPGHTGKGKEVPHFDNLRHKKTHDHVYEHIAARRRRTRASQTPDFEGIGPILRFALVTSAVGFIGWVGHQLGKRDERAGQSGREGDDRSKR
ncbi:hypothetical protein B0J11DRAFT_527733 [Dendryphion nanum]|uniref:J domain-containing protein n=1 Tax=Dendryphion nanum TaxID=256645 RepID=A0A9P9ILV9_9PLEO|nr:hypothetical protein B0J11DRAFT_527733 [Dendryphion nanum]